MEKFVFCRQTERGFTLLELLIVLVLIGLITGLVGPRLEGALHGVRARTVANRISAVLRYGRNMAVTDQKVREIRIEKEKNRVVLACFSETSDIVKAEVKSSQQNQVYIIPEGVFIGKIYSGTGRMVNDADSFSFVFYPVGNSSGGAVEVTDGRRQYRISVDLITGLVDVSE